jgi:hypothetical protein
MSETATLDTARDIADAGSRLIDHCLHPDGDGKTIQDIVNFAHVLWRMVRETWEQFQPRLDQGLEAGRARHAAASAAVACESLIRVITQLEGVVKPGAAEEVEGLSDLIAVAPKARAIQKAARDLVDLLNAPEPPIDETRLNEGLAAAKRGDFEDTAAIIERLRAGGEL